MVQENTKPVLPTEAKALSRLLNETLKPSSLIAIIPDFSGRESITQHLTTSAA